MGSKVSEFKRGDKVATLFNQAHQYGDMTAQASQTGLGGVIDGALRQYGTYNESGLVKCPANLNALESSSLPCAALTSWNTLYGLKPLKPGQTVLVQGTGGVSIFALQVSRRPCRTASLNLTCRLVRQSRRSNRDRHNVIPRKSRKVEAVRS